MRMAKANKAPFFTTKNVNLDNLDILGFKLIGLEQLPIKYSENQLKELAQKLKWEGDGSENNPIIIRGNQGLPMKFGILESNLFIQIADCTFANLTLDRCQNISIENSMFHVLGVVRSTNNYCKNCFIGFLSLARAANNHFKDSTIKKGSNFKSQENTFKDCTFKKRAQKHLLKDDFEFPNFGKQLPLIIIVLAVGIFCFSTLYIINSTSPGLELPLLIGALLCMIVIYFKWFRKKENKDEVHINKDDLNKKIVN